MEEDTETKEPDAPENDTPNGPAARARTKRKTFSVFLIESDVKPLILLGKCGQYFGWVAVCGFLLGAGLVYGYALFKPLPYSVAQAGPPLPPPTPQPTVQPPTQLQKIRLRGFVDDEAGPMKEPFMVGVLASQHGPIQHVDGSFVIEVPLMSTYDIALWNSSAERIAVYSGYPAERNGETFELFYHLPFFRGPRPIAAPQSAHSAGRARLPRASQRIPPE